MKLLFVVVLGTLIGVIMAQSLGATCCSIAPSSVAVNTRLAWCRAEQNTCPELCSNGQTSTNSCDSDTLSYSCTCSIGVLSPNVSDYSQTLPSFMCDEWKRQCVAANPNNLASQNTCLSYTCGTKNATAAAVTSSSTSSTSRVSSASSAASSASSAGARSSTGTVTAGAATSSASESSTQGDDNSNGKSGGISGGAIAGIVVGVLVLLAIALAAFLLWRRQRKKRAAQSFSYHRSTVSGMTPELAGAQVSRPAQFGAADLDAKNERMPATELTSTAPAVAHYHHQQPPSELATAASPRAELASYQQQSPYQLPPASPHVPGAMAVPQTLPSEQQPSPLPEVYGAPAPVPMPGAPQTNVDALRAELERIRQQRLRLTQMQELEEREMELLRMIAEQDRRK